MLKHLTLKDFVIVSSLELEFGPGFCVLTGETGAGKSILIDALQLALGARADAMVVREGGTRAEISASFDCPPGLRPWLEGAGFAADDELLLRRIVDAQGKSRAFINGSPATAAQLREAADWLVDIHGQHAWQGLTRPASVRALLDDLAGVDSRGLVETFQAWRLSQEALAKAQQQQEQQALERDRLAWQIGEVERLAPGDDEWPQLNAEHQRLAHGQALLEAAAAAAAQLSEDEDCATRRINHALSALENVAEFDSRLAPVVEALQAVTAQLDDASHSLKSYLSRTELDPQRLAELDSRLSTWIGLARRFRRPPEELPALLQEWRDQLHALEASADLERLGKEVSACQQRYAQAAAQASKLRSAAAGPLAERVTAAMQTLGMQGGQFAVSLVPVEAPQAFGQENIEFLVAGHAGSAPRPLGKVASGGELSRLALAIAVTTAQQRQTETSGLAPAPATLIFDEVDSGIGGKVADTVGRLMQQLGSSCQVLAVTHLAQVAACAHTHLQVSKQLEGSRTSSRIALVQNGQRVAELARMLGGESASALAHAAEMLELAAKSADGPARGTAIAPASSSSHSSEPTSAPPAPGTSRQTKAK